MQMTPGHELEARIGRFQGRLMEADLDGALIVQRADLYYFSGTIQAAHLYVPVDGAPVLMVRKSLARAKQESQLDPERIVPLGSTRSLLEALSSSGLGRPRLLGLELDVMPVNTFRRYERLFDGVQLLDCSPLIRSLRAVKSQYELEILRRTGSHSAAIFQAIPELLRAGISEVELAGQIEAVARGLGHSGMAEMRHWNTRITTNHLMAGWRAAVPSYLASPTGGLGVNPATAQGASLEAIRPGEPVLVDFLFGPDGYIVDQTRIFVLGELPDVLSRGHEAMLAVQAAVVEMAGPGVTGDRLWRRAQEVAADCGMADHFMGHGEDRVRFVGHGVGLEVDELPVLAAGQHTPLEPGMVIAVEPKAIYPGLGVVGIENTFAVTEHDLERLTPYPDEVGRV